MSDEINPAETTVEESICAKWNEAKSAIDSRLKDGEAYVREEPLQAIAYAVVAGYVLRILPVGAILRTVVRIGLSAVKPVAVVYGAAKAYEIIVKSRNS